MSRTRLLLLRALLVILVATAYALTPAAQSNVSAAPDPGPGGPVVNPTANTNVNSVQNGLDEVGGNSAGNRASDFTTIFRNVINIILFLVGAIAVLAIIIGAIRFVTSAGDAGSTKAARETVIYAVVGVVVAFLAYALVNWVIFGLGQAA